MESIFDQYGIKEVADVTLYSIHKKKDGSGDLYYLPALHLDTLKISSVEKTADNTWAEGGYGNSRLINWDFNKQIDVTLEDALCTPASLSMCWGGVLSADWKDAEVKIKSDVCVCRNPLNKITRFEKAFYPSQNNRRVSISQMLPKLKDDNVNELDLLTKSSIIDGTNINGVGRVDTHNYKWKMAIESTVKSIAVIPDRFFDVKGKLYKIDQARKVSVSSLPDYENLKNAIIYKINSSNIKPPKAKIIFDYDMEKEAAEAEEGGTKETPTTETTENDTKVNYNQNRTMTNLFNQLNASLEDAPTDTLGTIIHSYEAVDTCKGDYLAIIVDNNDDYYALIGLTPQKATEQDSSYDDGTNAVKWYKPAVPIKVKQFKGIDMWLRFQSINEMAYFMITKYENDIQYIDPATVNSLSENWAVNKSKTEVETNTDNESTKAKGKLWAYVNPRTMTPYPDDYWFHQGEPYYIKSLTLAEEGKKIKGKRIAVKAGQFPGMYMMVGETYIRSYETGKDERMQIKFPLCKVRSEQTITLEADGEPTTFNLSLEVAKPRTGDLMEINFYEVADRVTEGEDGCFYLTDGSTIVLSE